jgi:hydrogenase maturation protease
MTPETIEAPGEATCRALARALGAKSVVVGIGNRDRGDDGFGPAVVEALRAAGIGRVVDAGVAPENYLGQIVASEPDVVLVVDAAELAEPPGTVRLADVDEFPGTGFGTHAGGLSLLLRYLEVRLGRRCLILAVQPETTTGQCLSPAVRTGLAEVVRAIASAMNPVPCAESRADDEETD